MSDKNSQLHFSGPIFDPGLGWSGRLENFIKARFYSSVLPLIVLAILGVGTYLVRSPANPPKAEVTPTESVAANQNSTTPQAITETTIARDSYSRVVRRALASYLSQHTDIVLAKGQKLFIETTLSKTLAGQSLKAGSTITISGDALKNAITSSKSLTASQLQKWAAYAKNVPIP